MATNRVTTVGAEVLAQGGVPTVRFTAVEAEVLTPGAAAKARITEMGVQVLVSTAVFIPPTANSAPVIICVT